VIRAIDIIASADTDEFCASVALPTGTWGWLNRALLLLMERMDGDADDIALARHYLLQWAQRIECAEESEPVSAGPPLGTIITSIVEWLGQDGYLPMRGDTYQINDYAMLAAGLPAAWRDTGAGTFTLPDMTGLLVVGATDGGDLFDIQQAGHIENRHIEQIVAPVLAREQATAQSSNASRGVMYTRTTTGTGTAFTLAVGDTDPDDISDILPTIKVYYHIKYTL
jgi:microcystin-dependent protein